MNNRFLQRITAILAVVFLPLLATSAQATIDGVVGPSFGLVAKAGRILTPDGGSLLMWGYANGSGGIVQYPGVTMLVNQGDTVTVSLTNTLTVPVSIVFPGQEGVVATEVTAPTQDGLLTKEALPGGSVSYTFVATHPGTFIYHSGSRPELQVEMGLLGALIVRPSLGAGYAYNHVDTRFDREYLFLLTEMDPSIHDLVEGGFSDQVDTTTYWPVYWFINGRAAPDTMLESNVPWLPNQPYNAMPRMHPGEKLLMRVIGSGHEGHPFHNHGNHARTIARDGRLLESFAGAGPDLGHPVFTIQANPDQTTDAIFEWTGKDLGWDVYGSAPHTCTPGPDGLDTITKEYCADHGKAFPTILPDPLSVTYGSMWGGSPFLGLLGSLPPGQGGLNPSGGYFFMWHSHTEREMTNFDIFPGGMMTMLIVEAPGVPIM